MYARRTNLRRLATIIFLAWAFCASYMCVGSLIMAWHAHNRSVMESRAIGKTFGDVLDSLRDCNKASTRRLSDALCLLAETRDRAYAYECSSSHLRQMYKCVGLGVLWAEGFDDIGKSISRVHSRGHSCELPPTPTNAPSGDGKP